MTCCLKYYYNIINSIAISNIFIILYRGCKSVDDSKPCRYIIFTIRRRRHVEENNDTILYRGQVVLEIYGSEGTDPPSININNNDDILLYYYFSRQ